MAIYMNRSDDRKILAAQEALVVKQIKAEQVNAFNVSVKLHVAKLILATETARFKRGINPGKMGDYEKIRLESSVREEFDLRAQEEDLRAQYAQERLDVQKNLKEHAKFKILQKQALRSRHDAMQILADDGRSSSDDFDDEDYHKPSASRGYYTPERRPHCPKSSRKGHIAHSEMKGHFVYTRG